MKLIPPEDTIPVLRETLYCALCEPVQQMDTALGYADREEVALTHAAYKRLTLVGVILDQLGWTDDEPEPAALTLEDAELEQLREAVRTELPLEAERGDDARAHEDAEAEAVSTRHSAALQALARAADAAKDEEM